MGLLSRLSPRYLIKELNDLPEHRKRILEERAAANDREYKEHVALVDEWKANGMCLAIEPGVIDYEPDHRCERNASSNRMMYSRRSHQRSRLPVCARHNTFSSVETWV
jgi:hypothetical protein